MNRGASGERDESRAGAAWVLLIYTVPASPTSKRAAVWREVKRLGALYLRNGVCALPDTPEARAGLEALRDRVLDLGGQATVAWDAGLSPATADELLDELSRSRQAEHAEVAEEAAGLLRHIRKETDHHELERSARATILGDISRLHRWLEQVMARDYLQVGDAAPILAMLSACSAALEVHPVSTSRTTPEGRA